MYGNCTELCEPAYSCSGELQTKPIHAFPPPTGLFVCLFFWCMCVCVFSHMCAHACGSGVDARCHLLSLSTLYVVAQSFIWNQSLPVCLVEVASLLCKDWDDT